MPAHHCLLLRRDLSGSLPAAMFAPGIGLARYTPELARDVHGLLMLGYSDGSGDVADFAEWHDAWAKDAEFDATLCLLAIDDQGLVGVALSWTSAFLKDLVVHPHARNRGIGRALLLSAFALFQQRGEACLDLKVMENNLRARHLYERAGMQVVRREAL